MREIFTVIAALISLAAWSQPKPGGLIAVNIAAITNVSSLEPVTSRFIRCGRTEYSTKILLIIDGIPHDNSDIKKINPDEIESITVIKSGESTVLWRCRGADGFILVTTKSSKLRKFIIKDFLDGKTIPGATVKFMSQDKTDSLIQIANDSGIVITNKLKAGVDYDVEVSSIGFNSYNIRYKNSSTNKEQIIFLEKKIRTLSEVVVTSIEPNHRRCPSCCCWQITYNNFSIPDSIQKTKAKVYPNPIHRGNNFNLELPTTISPASSSYVIRIISLSGTIIHQQKVDSNKWKTVSIASSNRWAAGTYFVQVLNDKGKPCGQHKIIIQ